MVKFSIELTFNNFGHCRICHAADAEMRKFSNVRSPPNFFHEMAVKLTFEKHFQGRETC